MALSGRAVVTYTLRHFTPHYRSPQRGLRRARSLLMRVRKTRHIMIEAYHSTLPDICLVKDIISFRGFRPRQMDDEMRARGVLRRALPPPELPPPSTGAAATNNYCLRAPRRRL